MGEYDVLVKPPGRRWSALGKELYRGAVPENFLCSADPWGFATCTFDLRRDPSLPQPDLASWTPCDAKEAGAVIFEGRVQETPSQGREGVRVAGRGWQYALDDNPIDKNWLLSDLSAWVDTRTLPGVDLASWRAGPTVDTGTVVRIGWPKGTDYVAGGQAVGVTLDLGPDRRAHGVVGYYEQANLSGNGAIGLYARGSTTIAGAGDQFFGGVNAIGGPDAFVAGFGNVVGGTLAGVFGYDPVSFAPSTFRYVHVFLYLNAAAASTTGLDHVATIRNLTVFAQTRDVGLGPDTTGQNWPRSNLRGSDVVRDAVALGAPKVVVRDAEPEEFADEVRAINGTKLLDAAVASGQSGPTRWWRGNPNGAATGASDSAVGGADMTQAGGVLLGQAPGPLTAESERAGSQFLRLDGVDDYLFTPAVHPWEFTVFLLFRTSATQGTAGGANVETGAGLFSGGSTVATPAAGYLAWWMGIAGGQAFATTKDPGGARTSYLDATPANDGKWHSLAFGRYYRDGSTLFSLDARGIGDADDFAGGANPGLRHDPNANWHAGARISGGFFNGDLAEVAVFPTLLAPQQVRELHRAALARVASPVKRTLLCLPSIATSEPRTPRESCEGVNTFHRYLMKVGSGRELHFRPQPTVPKFALTQDAVDRFLDASLNSGDEQYNRAVVVGQAPDGTPVRVERLAGQLPGAHLVSADDHVAHPNPSLAAANTDGWRALTGTLDRAFSVGEPVPHTLPAAVWVDPGSGPSGAANPGLQAFFNGVFLMGRRYRLTVWLKPSDYGSGGPYNGFSGLFGMREANDYSTGAAESVHAAWGATPPTGTQGYIQHAFEWVPRRNYAASAAAFSGPQLRVEAPRQNTGTGSVGVVADDLELAIYQGTSMLDRNNDLRTKIITFQFPIVVEVASALADAFLLTHQRVPLRGTVSVGPDDVTSYRSGRPVHPRVLVDNVGELLHLPGLPDPDTGGVGRDGFITAVSNYSPGTEQAEVAIDNQRDSFEAMLQRMALVTGGG